jgi:uridylate kinase
MGCDALLKGTSVDGVYTADPKKEPDARRYERLSYHEVLSKNLRVMDASAISLMRENAIPIVVFSIREPGNLLKVIDGRGVYTTIEDLD